MIFLVCALVLALVAYWNHIDTKYRQVRNRWTRREANLAIYKERKSELSSDQCNDERQGKEQASDIDLILLDDEVDSGVAPIPGGQPSSRFSIATIALIVLLPLCGYWIWGDPFAIRLENIQERIQNSETPEELDDIIDLLQSRNSSRHGDVASANYLISLYAMKEDFENVVREHKLAEQRGRDSLVSDIERVRAAFELDGRRITDETQVVVDRVLSQVPDHPMILQLLAVQAYLLSDFPKARESIERLFRQSLGPRVTSTFDSILSETNKNLDSNHVGVRVNLQIEDLVTSNRWLTVFAHLDDGSPPIAVIRRSNAISGNYSLLLDDIVSMIPGRSLSTFDRVKITARLSASPNVADFTHATQVQSGWISPSPNATISLRLSEKVAGETITVTVALAPEITVDNEWPVFIVGRPVDATGPPLVVKRILVSDLPTTLELSTEDTMLPNSVFPDGDIEVFARISRSGSATRSEGDIESERVSARLGQSVGLKIDKVVEFQEEP